MARVNENAQNLLIELARTRTLSDAKRIVAELEAKFKFRWRPVGDRENNFGTISIGSDPGSALVERITNAIDAVIEREAASQARKRSRKPLPASPREAVEAWFGLPGGRLANVDTEKRQKLADNIFVRLLSGASKRKPTVEILDHGIGLSPKLVPSTILSLNESNKVDKPYLAGAYGQGGSTVLAFSPQGTLFVSRRDSQFLTDDDKDEVAVTFARYNELDPRKDKNGRFEYLVTPKGEVPGLPVSNFKFGPGTAVIHFDLEIPQYSQRMTQLTGSLWWLLQNALFDPVLPVWAEEHRQEVLKDKKQDRRTISGNNARLSDHKNDKVEHKDTVMVTVPHYGGETNVRVNYWVLKQDDEAPTAQPIDSYVDPHRPIAYTFNGQTHGTDERRFVTDRLALPYLAKFFIMQVELDHLNPHARRELLSTTRDRLRQMSFHAEMRERIASALDEDEELHRLDHERKEKILSHHSAAERAKLRERFARLMERFKAGIDARAPAQGREKGGRVVKEPGNRIPLVPLKTKADPTYIKIANTQKPIVIRLDRNALVRLESDAPDAYLSNHTHAKLSIGCEPQGLLALESKSDFKGGRARLTVRPTDKAKSGDTGKLTVFLFTPDERSMSSSTSFRTVKPEEVDSSGTSKKSKVQVPDPIPVHKDQWGGMGGWTDASVADVREDKEGTKIYVNMDNRHITRLLHGGGYQEVGVKRMKNSYLLYVAFYSWIQHIAEKNIAIDNNNFDEYKDKEMDRVAQLVVHSISASGRLDSDDED